MPVRELPYPPRVPLILNAFRDSAGSGRVWRASHELAASHSNLRERHLPCGPHWSFRNRPVALAKTMSRQWKKPNHGLPGWHSYHLSDRRPKPNKKRKFFKQRAKLQAVNKKIDRAPLKRVAFESHQPGILRKLLRLSGPSGSADCLWERRHGSWHCTTAPAPFEWFTRVRHPEVIRSWLIQNHFEFHWLSLPQSSATIKPAGPSTGASRTGTPATPISVSPERPQDDQSLYGSGLARNGVETSSPLNTPGCPGNSQNKSLLH